MSNDVCRVTTGEARLSYVHLFKPYAFQQGQEEKYSVTVLVPKTDVETKARIDAAIEAAKQRGIADKWNGVLPPKLTVPIHDGDGPRPSDGMPFGDECRGHWVFTASAKADYKPQVVDAGGVEILNQSEVYSGMYGRVNVKFAPYSFGSNRGVSCYLGPVMKTRDGEGLGGGRVTAAQAFGIPVPQAPMGAGPGPMQGQPAPQAPVHPAAGAVYNPGAQAAPMYQAPAYSPGMAAQPAGDVNPITGLPY